MNFLPHNLTFLITVLVSILVCVLAEPISQTNNSETGHEMGRGLLLDENEWSPGAKMLARLAREIIARSTGNTQVVSLNLTSLLILLVLKAIVFAAGLVGAGNWQQHYARSLDNETSNSPLSAEELNLILSFLESERTGKQNCILQAACKAPKQTTRYLEGARVLLKLNKIIQSIMDYNPRYELLVQRLDGAIEVGKAGRECKQFFPCFQ